MIIEKTLKEIVAFDLLYLDNGTLCFILGKEIVANFYIANRLRIFILGFDDINLQRNIE